MPRTDAQRNPALCAGLDGSLGLVWQEGVAGSERIRLALADAPAGPWRAPVPVDDGPGPAWDPDCGVLEDGRIGVVWAELGGGIPRVRFAAADPALPMFAASIEVDATAMGASGSQLQPAMDGPHVVWLDQREGSWDVYFARWQGDAFSPALRVSGAPEGERLHADPDVVADGARVVVAWSDLHGARAQSDIGLAISDDGGTIWSGHTALPGGVDEVGGAESCTLEDQPYCGTMSRLRPMLAAGPTTIALAFQDLSPGRSAIMTFALDDDDAPLHLDDLGDAALAASRPQLAYVDGLRLIAWLDARAGWTQIRVRALEEMHVE
jgi:hypothetical protein